MAGPTFDPNGAVRFDLKSGTAADAKGARVVLVPSAALEALDAATLERLGAEIGRACGARVAARLGGDAGVRGAALETVVSHLAGELAVAGIGALSIERWGRAMVGVVANPSVASDAFLAGVLAAAIGAASGREIASAPLGRDRGITRFYLGSRAGADKARALAAQGRPYVEIVGAIQGGAS
jgi:hypothetical protein